MQVLLKVLKYKYKYIIINKADSYDLTMSHIHLGHHFPLITFAVNTMHLQNIYQHDTLNAENDKAKSASIGL